LDGDEINRYAELARALASGDAIGAFTAAREATTGHAGGLMQWAVLAICAVWVIGETWAKVRPSAQPYIDLDVRRRNAEETAREAAAVSPVSLVAPKDGGGV
jgi:hypothetical protein